MESFRKKLSPLLLMANLAGCSLDVTPLNPEILGPTILLRNKSMESITLKMRYGLVGTANPGETRCLILGYRGKSFVRLNFEYGGERYFTPDFSPLSTRDGGWRLTIGNTPSFDALSLEPHPRCR